MFDFNRLRDPDNQSYQLNLKNNFLESKIKQTNYEIINEIPRFTDNSYATNFGDQWKVYDKDQFDDQEGDYEHLKRSFDTLQLCFPHTLSNLKNKLVLEAGSGNGRFTHVLLNHKAIVDTFDLSYSVDALKKINGLVDTLNEFAINNKKPLLGICVGLQMFANIGYEETETKGLGWVSGKVSKIDNQNGKYKLPHIGWNQINIVKESKIFKGIENNSHMYFVHSYEFVPEDKNVVSATTEYSSNIVCSVEKENIFGTQFHPEKSDKIGLKIIENFMNL